MAKDVLTFGQERVLGAIQKFIKAKGYSPTYREIADSIGLHSKATVMTHVKALEAKGRIKREANGSRTITIVKGAK